jgi:hypothetical protein
VHRARNLYAKVPERERERIRTAYWRALDEAINRQRLPRVLTHPHGEQLVYPSLDLRRRRYGTSHGVGPPSIVFAGLEGTYAVALTAPAPFTALLGRHPPRSALSLSSSSGPRLA